MQITCNENSVENSTQIFAQAFYHFIGSKNHDVYLIIMLIRPRQEFIKMQMKLS